MDLRSGIPYWRLINGSHVCYPVLDDDLQCEIVIIGAGITGALAAYRLSQENLDIIVLDKRDIGSGSTAACTGLLQYEIDVELADLIDQVGLEAAVRSYRLGVKAVDAVRALTEALGDDCGFADRMSLYLASKKAHLPKLRHEFEMRKKFDFDVAFVDELELRERFSLRAVGAILSKPAAQVDPLRLTQQLIAAAAARGARIFEQTSVKRIDWGQDEALLTMQNGPRLRAKRVLFASGYESLDYLQHKVGRLHSTFALVSAPLRDVNKWTKHCIIWETARPYFYARNTVDGRIMIGGMDTEFTNDHSELGIIPKKAKQLEHRFNELCPGTRIEATAAWAGVFGDTKDGLAYIGTSPEHPQAYFALGYSGNGIAFSVLAAEIITDLHLGRPNADAEIFRFGR
jgi:glycine/D-amino acid oxidase-like deaminating enzyme